MLARKAARTGVRFPSPPVFARDKVASVDCRGAAKGEAGHLLIYKINVASYASASQAPFMKFTYVYILQSEANPDRFYTGATNDLRKRIKRHNAGSVPHSSKWKPWTLKTYIALSDRKRATDLEKYLKSHSGRAFVKKRL